MNGSNSDEDAFRFHGVDSQQPVTWPSPGRRIQDTWQGDGPVDQGRGWRHREWVSHVLGDECPRGEWADEWMNEWMASLGNWSTPNPSTKSWQCPLVGAGLANKTPVTYVSWVLIIQGENAVIYIIARNYLLAPVSRGRERMDGWRQYSRIPSDTSHSSNTKPLKAICSPEVGFALNTPINVLKVLWDESATNLQGSSFYVGCGWEVCCSYMVISMPLTRPRGWSFEMG